MFDPVIAPSGTLLGLLQRGRGDGTLHALTAPRAEALAALNHCVLRDPRHDWQVENRSLYYARLYLDLRRRARRDRGPPLRRRGHPRHRRVTHRARPRGPRPPRLLRQAGRARTAAQVRRHRLQLGLGPGRTGPAGRRRRAARPRRPRARPLPGRRRGRRRAGRRRAGRLRAPALAAVGRRPARIDRHARACRPGDRAASTAGNARCGPAGPAPAGASQAVFEWAQQGIERGAALHVPAARCLSAVAGPEDRPEIVEAARAAPRAPAAPPCAISPTATTPTPST